MILLTLIASLLIPINGYFLPTRDDFEGRIVGDNPAQIIEAPWQAALLYDTKNDGKYSFACGGAIIDRNLALTTASCVNGTEARRWTIRVGSTSYNDGGSLVGVSRIVQHKDFNSRWQNNIALIFLDRIMFLNAGVDFAALPKKFPEAGNVSTVTGWGILHSGDEQNPVILQKVRLPVVEQQLCKDIYEKIGGTITEDMFCAGYVNTSGIGACKGDGGGPVTIENKILAGLTSWGFGCGMADFPPVFVNVVHFVDWIIETVQGPSDK